jgi:hypothetical protein
MQQLRRDNIDPALDNILDSAENLDTAVELPQENRAELHSKALWLACKNNDVAMVVQPEMIAAGGDVHWHGDFALVQAVRSNHLTVVSILLANGANIHASQDVALCLAVIHNFCEMARLLLTLGCWTFL